MLPTQVALVPFEADNAPPPDQISRVAAALQMQIVRDFSPIWGVSAIVSPFVSLEDVPPECFPLTIAREKLPFDYHGFHLAMYGRPFALIHYDGEWSAVASHELMDMLCDPSGERTMPGPSLKDAQDLELDQHDQDPQGVVDYLVEVCDPCERSTYEINGVTVSDFVTPRYYYDTSRVEGWRYSFMGRVTEPRQLLAGGYLSWRTRHPRNAIWQAFAPESGPRPQDETGGQTARARGNPVPINVEELAIDPLLNRSRFSRASVDFQRKSHPPVRGAAAPEADATVTSSADAFRKDVQALIKLLKNPDPAPSIREIIGVLEALKAGNASAEEQLARLNLPEPVPDRQVAAKYDAILAALKQQQKVSGLFGPDMLDPGLASWLWRLTL